MTSLIALWLTVIVVAAVCPAQAQLIEAPEGAVGGVFGGHRPVPPNRNSHAFDVSFDLSGGYDSDPSLFLADSTPDGTDLTRWFASTATATTRYRLGSIRRSMEARGSAFYNYQSNAIDSILGGDASIAGTSRFGRNHLNELTAQFQSAYQPGFIFGSFGSSLGPGPDEPLVGGAAPQGVLEQRWLALAGSAGYEHHWNARQFTTTRYENRRVRPIEGDGLDADWQSILLDHSWSARPGLNVLGGYRWEENLQRDDDLDIPPVRYQTADMGFSIEHRSSASRRYTITFRGGATRLMESLGTSQLDGLQPSLAASVEFATSRYWGLSAQASRAVAVLSGVSPAPVLNDHVGLSFNGTPTRSLRYVVAAGVARGRTVATDPSLQNLTDVTSISGSIRYAMASWSAVFATYGYYHHRIEDPTLVVSGFPPEYDRRSFRMGMTLWVPLYGAF